MRALFPLTVTARRATLLFLIKPGFHMSGKSQTNGDFTFCRPSQILPIYRIFSSGLSQIFPIMNLTGTGAQQFRGLVISDADVPDDTNLSFHLSGMIADHRRNLERVGKIETLPILQICPRSSQTTGDIYNFF